MRVARGYLIRGRVQGVGFRYFAQSAAVREGVHGWVRNNPDGSVQIQAEAEVDAMERFERQIRHGPPGGRVDHLAVSEAPVTGGFTEFTIR